MNFNDLKNNLNTLNKESRIDELEKLKAEINNGYPTSIEDIIWIINNRIEELKGERNEHNN